MESTKRWTWMVVAALAGCGAPTDEGVTDAPGDTSSQEAVGPSAPAAPPPRESPASATAPAELGFGARGAEVERLYRYLANYGYFPNPELAAKYPGFEPLVAEAPADPALYDERFADAVLLLQRNMGLEATGIADAETLALTRQARCAWPDGYSGVPAAHAAEPGQQRQKFSDHWNFAGRVDFTWSVESNPASLTRAAFTGLAQEMVNEWKTVYDSPLLNVAPGTGQKKITWGPLDGKSIRLNPDGTCDTTANSNDGNCRLADASMTIDSAEEWEFTGTPTFPESDMRSVFLHEFGHTLGINHSDRSDSVMYATSTRGTVFRKLSADDRASVRSKYARWVNISTPAPVTDVAAGARFVIVSNEPRTNGYKMYRFVSGSTWELLSGAGVRVAVDARGRVWHINELGNIYYRLLDDSGWKQVTGCARDIGISDNGPPVVIGCDDQIYVGKMDPNLSDAQLGQQTNAGWWKLSAVGTAHVPRFINITGGSGIVPALATDQEGVLWFAFGTAGMQPVTALQTPMQVADIVFARDGTIWGTQRWWEYSFGAYAYNLQNARKNTEARSGWKGYDDLDAVRITSTWTGRPYIVTSTGQLRSTSK